VLRPTKHGPRFRGYGTSSFPPSASLSTLHLSSMSQYAAISRKSAKSASRSSSSPDRQPLRITWSGPSLDQRVLAAGQSHRVPSRPNTLHKILLSPQGPAKKRAAGAAPPTWFLEIKEHLGGQREDSIVEVIRCDAYPATEDSATSKSKVNVVLKLYPRSQAEEDPHKPTRTRLGHHLPEYAKLMERYHGSSRITRTATVFR